MSNILPLSTDSLRWYDDHGARRRSKSKSHLERWGCAHPTSPGAGVAVRVRHEVVAGPDGNTIVYRCQVEGASGEVCAEVGQEVTSDFDEVLASLAAAAER